MSSQDASQRSETRDQQIEPCPMGLSFIVHSTDALPMGLSSHVDDKQSLSRQKRRRTSPEDQLTLEVEYARNSKPDKAARMAIVQRVSLGEKEVQIWFQNRRQASRRKLRPLEPHEIAQYQSSRPVSDGPLAKHSDQDAASSIRLDNNSSRLDRDIDDRLTGEIRSRSNIPKEYTSKFRSSSFNEILSSQEGQVNSLAQTSPDICSPHDSPIENRIPRKSLSRRASYVRLSMNSEGVARIITENDSSPSPPRKMSSQSSSRSDRNEMYSIDGSLERALRKPSGRALDSRAWHFWADRDSRSGLEEKAQQEISGSAAEAIGLLRSASGRSILGCLGNKRSSLNNIDENPSKKPRRAPLLQRSQSLQNWSTGPQGLSKRSSQGLKKAQSGLGIRMFTADSDKENWSPDRQTEFENTSTYVAEYGRRRSTITPGKLLSGIEEHARSARSLSSNGEEEEDDEEVAEFMRKDSDRKSDSLSEEEELGCVQGLLSLSQGNWK